MHGLNESFLSESESVVNKNALAWVIKMQLSVILISIVTNCAVMLNDLNQVTHSIIQDLIDGMSQKEKNLR